MKIEIILNWKAGLKHITTKISIISVNIELNNEKYVK
jgi:hypothetical protein